MLFMSARIILTFSLFFFQVSTVLSRMSEIGMQSKLIYKESIHWKRFRLNLVLVNKQIGTTGKHLVSWKNHGCMVFFFFTRLYNSLVFELFPLLRENNFPNPLRLFSPLPPPDDDDDDEGGELFCFPF